MKTTLEISDPVYRQVKARAALKGQTVKAFVVEAIKDKLEAEQAARQGEPAWRAVFGKAPAGAVEQLQTIIDEEFARIDPEQWR